MNQNDNEEKEIKILLIDLENCPNQIGQLQNDLTQYTQVIICYAKTEVKIPLEWLTPLSKTVVENKLKIYKMTQVGKNSADFGICFFAGMLMQQFQKAANFTIISNDKDLNHVVNLLISQGCHAKRVGIKKKESPTTTKKPIKVSPIKSYCIHLSAHPKSRPSKKETLLNSIQNCFKQDKLIVTDNILKLLITKKALSIVENKVIYHNKMIDILAGIQ